LLEICVTGHRDEENRRIVRALALYSAFPVFRAALARPITAF
jgi:hypothetical protein